MISGGMVPRTGAGESDSAIAVSLTGWCPVAGFTEVVVVGGNWESCIQTAAGSLPILLSQDGIGGIRLGRGPDADGRPRSIPWDIILDRSELWVEFEKKSSMDPTM
jgi:hypothetical protein